MGADTGGFAQCALRDVLAAVGADDDVRARAVARVHPDVMAAGDVAGELVVVAGGAAGDDQQAIAAAETAKAREGWVGAGRPGCGGRARQHGLQGVQIVGALRVCQLLVKCGDGGESFGAAARDRSRSALPFFSLMKIPPDIFLRRFARIERDGDVCAGMLDIGHVHMITMGMKQMVVGAEEFGVMAEFAGAAGTCGIGINFFDAAQQACALGLEIMQHCAACIFTRQRGQAFE